MLRHSFLFVTAFALLPKLAVASPYCSDGSETSVVVRHIEAALGPAAITRVGPVGDTMATELQGLVCSDTDVSELLANSCGGGPTSAAELRPRLVTDLLQLPERSLDPAELSPEDALAVAFVSAVTGGVEPAEVTHRVAVALGYAGAECTPPVVSASDPVGVAVAVAWAVAQDSNVARSVAESEQAVAGALTTARGGAPPGGAETALVHAVAVHSGQLFAWRAKWQENPSDAAALNQLLLAEYTLFQHCLGLALGQATTLPPEAWATISAVVAADLSAAVERLRSWLVARSRLDSAVLVDVADLHRLARAQTAEDAERIVRERLLPWSQNFLFSASAGIPSLARDDFNVIGEGMLGYQDDAWGLAGSGGIAVVDFESDEYVASTVKLQASADGWMSLELRPGTRLDLRAEFEMVALDSDTVAVSSAATVSGSETSVLVRGGGLLGVRHQQPGLALGAWAGGAGQVESYDSRATIVAADNPTQLRDLDSASGAFQGRARVQWGFIPGVLSLRLSADGKFYKLARLSAAIDTSVPLDQALVETDEEAQQLEILGRAYIDVDVVDPFGFVPAAGVGIDHYQLGISGQPTQVTTIPLFLVGIRRTVF